MAALSMSALEGEADHGGSASECPLLTQSGHLKLDQLLGPFGEEIKHMLAVGLNHSIPTNAQVIRETLNKTFEEIN